MFINLHLINDYCIYLFPPSFFFLFCKSSDAAISFAHVMQMGFFFFFLCFVYQSLKCCLAKPRLSRTRKTRGVINTNVPAHWAGVCSYINDSCTCALHWCNTICRGNQKIRCMGADKTDCLTGWESKVGCGLWLKKKIQSGFKNRDNVGFPKAAGKLVHMVFVSFPSLNQCVIAQRQTRST